MQFQHFSFPPKNNNAMTASVLSTNCSSLCQTEGTESWTPAGVRYPDTGVPAERTKQSHIWQLRVERHDLLHKVLMCGLLYPTPVNSVYISIIIFFSMVPPTHTHTHARTHTHTHFHLTVYKWSYSQTSKEEKSREASYALHIHKRP